MPTPARPDRRVYDDASVEELRRRLRRENGIRGLEICDPGEVERALRIYRRDAFVVVRDLLDTDQLARWREGCTRVLGDILSVPGQDGRKYATETMRLPHRYSYGSSSGSRHMLHDPAWAGMVDLPTTTPIITAIFGSSEYRVWGAGGDLCLPGAIEYQHLHRDGRDHQLLPEERIEQARTLGVEMTPPLVTINFLMCDLRWENGQISGTHSSQQPLPSQAEEPDWMRHSILVGATAGFGVIRDNRVWHGATPNLSREIRAMPNVEYSPSWRPREDYRRAMPHEIWETLSPHARVLCDRVMALPGAWPPGAGLMHPVAGRRTELVDK